MPKKSIVLFLSALLLASCSPRDVLSRRLAADLISASDAFKTPQQYTLQTGIVSNQDYASAESSILQSHGWISAATIACPPGLTPPPCWDVLLTPSGVDTVRSLLSAEATSHPSFAIPVARREFVAVTGIFKQGNIAEVDFTWRWVPLNEIGAALHSSRVQYNSTVGFRDYDDGWRIVQTVPHSSQTLAPQTLTPQTLDDALKSAEPAP
jgi:hypothetical protein